MSSTAQRESATMPLWGKPFLESFTINHGPAPMLGRFFLLADQTMRRKGFTLEFASPDELAALNEKHQDSWPDLLPCLDTRVSNAGPSNLMVLVGRNIGGEPIVAKACRRLESGKRSLDELINSGDYLDFRPGTNINDMRAHCTAPSAVNLYGRMSYAGGLWVHPSHRGDRLAALFIHLFYACAVAVWNIELMVGALYTKDVGTDLHGRYQIPNYEKSLKFSENGVESIDAYLVWLTQADAFNSLQRYLEKAAAQTDGAVLPADANKSAAVR
jgi:hypothetical protein